jgi:hypothetical protein
MPIGLTPSEMTVLGTSLTLSKKRSNQRSRLDLGPGLGDRLDDCRGAADVLGDVLDHSEGSDDAERLGRARWRGLRHGRRTGRGPQQAARAQGRETAPIDHPAAPWCTHDLYSYCE